MKILLFFCPLLFSSFFLHAKDRLDYKVLHTRMLSQILFEATDSLGAEEIEYLHCIIESYQDEYRDWIENDQSHQATTHFFITKLLQPDCTLSHASDFNLVNPVEILRSWKNILGPQSADTLWKWFHHRKVWSHVMWLRILNSSCFLFNLRSPDKIYAWYKIVSDEPEAIRTRLFVLPFLFPRTVGFFQIVQAYYTLGYHDFFQVISQWLKKIVDEVITF